MAGGDKHYSDKHKHLEMIQAVINRMGSNSFVFKGWSITIITGISAFVANDKNLSLILIPFIATILFWSVDAYYLMLEREFRKLYKTVAAKNEDDIDFQLKAGDTSFSNWFKTVWRPILAVFYGVILLMLVVLAYVLSDITLNVSVNGGA